METLREITNNFAATKIVKSLSKHSTAEDDFCTTWRSQLAIHARNHFQLKRFRNGLHRTLQYDGRSCVSKWKYQSLQGKTWRRTRYSNQSQHMYDYRSSQKTKWPSSNPQKSVDALIGTEMQENNGGRGFVRRKTMVAMRSEVFLTPLPQYWDRGKTSFNAERNFPMITSTTSLLSNFVKWWR